MINRFLSLPGYLWLLFCSDATAQQHRMRFEHYDQAAGLSQGTGNAICRYNNYMWFGTQDGLNRFDGYHCKVYRSGSSNGLKSNLIQALMVDSKGRFWVGTGAGVRIYDAENDRFRSLREVFGLRHPLDDTILVNGLFEDRQENIWLVTDSEGLFRYTPHTRNIRNFFPRATNITGLSMEESGRVWITTVNGLFKAEPGLDTLTEVPLKEILGLDQLPPLYATEVDQQNRLWIGTYTRGVYVLKNEVPVLHFSGKNSGLGSNDITCLKMAANGEMWIGTRMGGLSIYHPQKGSFLHHQSSAILPGSIADDHIWSLYEDLQNIMWIGLSNKGINKYDPLKYPFGLIQKNYAAGSLPDNMIYRILGRSDQLYISTGKNVSILHLPTGQVRPLLTREKRAEGEYLSEVRAMVEDEQKNVWTVNYKGIACFNPQNSRFTTYPLLLKSTLYLFTAVFLSDRNEIWVGGQNGLYVFDLLSKKWKTPPFTEPFSNRIIRLLHRDSTGKIWIGTLGNGLLCYDPASGRLTPVLSGEQSRNIRSILEDGRHLWVGTDNGLTRLDLRTLRAEGPYTEKAGLPNNVIYAILKDENGMLWISTNKGIAKFSPSARRVIKTYDLSDGLQENEFNTSCAYRHPDGTLFFGGVNGISYFKPSQMKENRFPPPVKITQIKVLDSLYNPGSREVILEADQNFLDFQFVAFNFSNTGKNTYEYILEGINRQWIRAGTAHTASYTSLPPGNYTFKVKGFNNDGLPGPQLAAVRIRIQPAFYQTWWFTGLVLTTLTSTLFFILRNYIVNKSLKMELLRKESLRRQEEAEMKEKEARLQKQLAETEIMALHSQMNPHFIFNCLNSIKLYILDNDPVMASDYLTKFAKLIRLVLENTRLKKITLEKEIETLMLYIQMEEMRFKGKIRCKVHVADSLDTGYIEIPPLLLQPYVENAIWHGLMHKEEGGHIAVRISPLNTGYLNIEIRDNGIGRKKSAEYKSKGAILKKSFGMNVTYERIALLNHIFQNETFLEVTDLYDEGGEPAGTKVNLQIPI